MKHSVYTRCKYNTDQEVVERLVLTSRYTIPSILRQEGHRPFKWIWLCHPRHQELIEQVLRRDGWTGEIGFNEMKVFSYKETKFTARLGILAESGDEQIHTALDSDDIVHPRWIAEVQRHWRQTKKPYIVYWHPQRFEVATERWFRPAKLAWWPSMFYSIYNPNDKIHVYCASHNKLQTTGCPVHADPREGYVALVVHENNLHTTIKPTDREIKPSFDFR